MSNRRRFPLLERLRVSPPPDFSFTEGIYSGAAIGVDTEKLAYFAISIVWRGAVHEWRAPEGGTLRPIHLTGYQEPIRKWLIGETAFPPDAAVIVNVCTDYESQGIAYYPTRRLGIQATAFAFLVCGIHFTVYLGPTIPPVRQLCCFSSEKRLIFSRNIKQMTHHAFAKLASTTRPVGALVGP